MMNVESDTEPWGDKWRAGTSNFRTVAELFTKRNLWALAAFLDATKKTDNDSLLFAFQSNVLSGTIMQQWREAGGGFAKGTYYVPQVFIEREQFGCLARKVADVIAGKAEIANALSSHAMMISTQTATDLAGIPSGSLDYVFTDPPYAGKVQYGELNFAWEAWLDFDTHWHDQEIIVNETRGKTNDDWAAMMRLAMAECYRVLKPGHWLSLCYHDTAEGTWTLVQDIMAEVGFIPDRSDSALFIDTGQKSYNQLTADKVTKRDLVINFRKPRPGEAAGAMLITGDEDTATFGEKARAIIRDTLLAHPGATKDRVYDELVSRMVRAGQMQAHNFDVLLAQVAEPARDVGAHGRAPLPEPHEIVRWYLRETETAVADAAESAKEDAAAESVARFIGKRLAADPGAEGVHFSDIWEHYVYTVKDKPRRQLADWLADYFFRTETGTYRLPATEEERQVKAEGRAAGTSRLIRRYLAYLQGGASVPERERPSDATLAEWIRHCKRAGLYEQGKTLYEKGGLNLDALPEETMVNVEEDYQVCVRMLARAGASTPAKNPRRERGGQPGLGI
jgi:hypothetical protein